MTVVELELMDALWRLNEGSVREVLDSLPKGRDLAYTSVATVLKILEEKGMVRSRKNEKAHIYRPALTRTEYEARSLRHLQNSLFHGDSSAMVMRLLDETELSAEDLKAIRKLLDERLSSP